MTTVVVIGFEPFNEEMYPHTYEVLKIIESQCRLIYLDGDDRGFSLYKRALSRPNLVSRLKSVRELLAIARKAALLRSKIKCALALPPDFVIAIDHSALHYAAKYLNAKTGLIFWSQDIFTQDHPWYVSPVIKKLITGNRNDIRKARRIMVQDGNRAAVLDSVLMCHEIPKLYLPVSLHADDFSRKAAPKRPSRHLGDNIRLLQLGSINPGRASDLVLEAFQKTGPSVRLIFKGIIDPCIISLANKYPRKPKFLPLSKSFIEMRQAICEADIGIIACKIKNLNNYFFSRASGQLVEFIRLRIPVIIFDMEELGEFVERCGCGIAVKDADGVLSALEKITANYATFAGSCAAGYDTIFDLRLYEQEILESIS
jgi:glycosyltransferase involved in cell wall biosynthesis